METRLRIMCWNIAAGRRDDPSLPYDIALPEIADQIRAKSPDLVLLNEVHNTRGWPFGTGVNQVQRLAELTGLPHCHWGNTVATGLTGHKAVGILSRYPLGPARLHPVMRGTHTTDFATLETTVTVEHVVHHIFSTRFAPQNSEDHLIENALGIQQALTLVQHLPPQVAVIFGGDFNANMVDDPHFVEFVHKSGLVSAFFKRPDPRPLVCLADPEKNIDHIFYRGPYTLTQMEQRCPWAGVAPEVSDHPWVYVELLSVQPPEGGPVQHDWRWCHKCGGLFWAGGGPAAGRCVTGGAHERGASSDYLLLQDLCGVPGQHDWRWCHKCGGLFWAGGGTAAGRCPAGDAHERGTSSDYALVMDMADAPGQHDWRWCHKCGGLFWAGRRVTAGTCPAGATHERGTSSDYALVMQ